jgi:hypothetical protein
MMMGLELRKRLPKTLPIALALPIGIGRGLGTIESLAANPEYSMRSTTRQAKRQMPTDPLPILPCLEMLTPFDLRYSPPLQGWKVSSCGAATLTTPRVPQDAVSIH